jgi:hypothetical protein
MERYDIFKSEGGYRVAKAVYNDGPVLDKCPWYPTQKKAEKARDKAMADEELQEKIDEAINNLDIETLEKLDPEAAKSIRESK